MAKNTDTEVLKIDLDNKNFLQGISESQKALNTLGSGDSLDGLIGTFKSFGPYLAAAAGAVYGLKKAIDFTLEGENIKQINAQFDAMAGSLGLAADVMKNRLSVATKGLVDDTDVLRSASQAMSILGDNAKKLPEIFELARKSTALFAGDILERVNQISNALASGNLRSLRSIGINVDAEKSLKQYAAALGLTVDMLTESQKKQALMDSALAAMQTRFKNVNEDIKPLTYSIQQLKVIFADMAEAIMLAVNKFIGPSLVKVTDYFKDVAKSASLYLKEKLGDDAAAAERRIIKLSDTIKELDQNIGVLERREGLINKLLPDAVIEANIEKLKSLRSKAMEELSGLKSDAEKLSTAPVTTGEAPATAPGGVTSEQAAQLEADRMALVLRMREIEYQSALEGNQQMGTLEQERAAMIETIRAESQARIDAMRAAEPGKIKNIAEQELLIRKDAAAKIAAVNKQTEATKQKDFATTYSKLNLGQKALTSGMVAGFKAIGGGAAEMSKAMKAAFLNVIADKAEAQGATFIAEGIASWPFGASKIAGGSALVALSGLIRAAAGGGGGSMGIGGGGGGGGGQMPTAPEGTPATVATGDYSPRPELMAPQTRGRQVTIAIQGNYFETEQTRRQLVELIRQETDATSFAYTQISQGAV